MKIALAGVLMGLLPWGSPAVQAQSRADDGMFDPARVVAGITLSRPDCARLEDAHTAVWIETGGGRCLRYYAAGLASGDNPIAAVWLHGDIVGTNPQRAEKHQLGLGVAAMIEQERRLSERFGVPFLFLARPGSYGSAGKHVAERHRPGEAAVMAAALDALKRRYRIGAWALGGHSGGGTLVAEMLARRQDVRCAVISSGAAAYRAYLAARGLTRAASTPEAWFDPSAALDRVPVDPQRRIFILGDPRETNVPFPTQRLYYDGLIARGHRAWLVPLERASDPRHHNLVDWGETATGMCARMDPAEAILTTLESLPTPPPRISN